jgi:hypothetical protein
MTVTSILASNALTTYARAKAELQAIAAGATFSDETNQNAVELLINAVSDAVEAYCGRTFGKGTVSGEKHAATRDERLWLRRPPVSGTPTVTVDGSAVTDFSVEDAASGCLWRDAGWGGEGYQHAPVYGSGGDVLGSVSGATIPRSGEKIVSAGYTGGYILPTASSGTRDLPWAIELVVLRAVCLAWRLRQGGFAAPPEPGGILPPELAVDLNPWRTGVFG